MVVAADGIRSPMREAMFGPIRPKFTGQYYVSRRYSTRRCRFQSRRARLQSMARPAIACRHLLCPQRRRPSIWARLSKPIDGIVRTGSVSSSRKNCWPLLLGGIRSCCLFSSVAASSRNGRFSTVIHCWLGRRDKPPCLEMPLIRCCPSCRRARELAIEDGYVLGEAASAASTLQEALAFYEATRRPRNKRAFN